MVQNCSCASSAIKMYKKDLMFVTVPLRSALHMPCLIIFYLILCSQIQVCKNVEQKTKILPLEHLHFSQYHTVIHL